MTLSAVCITIDNCRGYEFCKPLSLTPADTEDTDPSLKRAGDVAARSRRHCSFIKCRAKILCVVCCIVFYLLNMGRYNDKILSVFLSLAINLFIIPLRMCRLQIHWSDVNSPFCLRLTNSSKFAYKLVSARNQRSALYCLLVYCISKRA
jgi:hypothetical protein